MHGYVYIIYVGHGMYKIGRGKDVGVRLRQLREDRVVEIIRTKYPAEIEVKLHRIFDSKRLSPGQEIFKLDDQDLLYIHNFALDFNDPDKNLLF